MDAADAERQRRRASGTSRAALADFAVRVLLLDAIELLCARLVCRDASKTKGQNFDAGCCFADLPRLGRVERRGGYVAAGSVAETEQSPAVVRSMLLVLVARMVPAGVVNWWREAMVGGGNPC